VLFTHFFEPARSLCGYCVPRGEVCIQDKCADNLKCVSIGFSKVCLPTVEAGQDCNTTDGLYDPCESGFYCNVKCVPISATSNINDGCIDDTYCRIGTTCVSGICKATTEATALCTPYTCKWNEICIAGTCTAYKGINEDCGSLFGTSNCKYGLSCYDQKCIEQFSVAKDGVCSDTSQCKTGLICKEGSCKEPKHVLLVGSYGAAWGAPCEPYLSHLDFNSGCRCHYGLHGYYFLKETSKTYNYACPQKRKDFEKCMIDKGCNGVNFGAMSCLRTNCYHFYAAMDDCFFDPSLTAPRCSGNAIMAAMILLVLMLFV
jgi:hypothetical protein